VRYLNSIILSSNSIQCIYYSIYTLYYYSMYILFNIYTDVIILSSNIIQCIYLFAGMYKINIDSVETGKCIERITCDNPSSFMQEALKEITILKYDEHTNEFFIGTAQGNIFILKNN
jgi:hypothetical protein